jgi:nitroreductase
MHGQSNGAKGEQDMDVMQVIKERRSARVYKDTPVDDKTVEFVLDAARWAPSWANTQCARFVVVRDNDIRLKLAETMGTNKATEGVKKAPVLIVACAEIGKTGYYKSPQPSTDKGDYWYMFDVALAMQNLTLAAHSLGLGTVHIGLFDARKAAEILEVPPGFCVVSMTPLGYPDGESKVPPRKELSELVSYDKFGSK